MKTALYHGAKRMTVLSLMLLATAVSGCSSDKFTRLGETEKALGTDSLTAQRQHRVVHDPNGFGFHFPGVLVAIEKAPAKTSDGTPSMVGHARWLEASDPAYACEQKSKRCLNTKHPDMRDNKDWLDKHLTDPKATFVSHIVRYGLDANSSIPRIRGTFDYNIYTNTSNDTAFNKGWDALLGLEAELNALAAEINATHILFYSIGWNTDQQEAIQNYNSLIGNLIEAAAADKTKNKLEFRPLVIGLSWPSFWDGPAAALPPLSYVNKANDADETALLWGNLLLNKVIKNVKDERKLPVVVLGHSFGARLTTTATFAYPLLSESSSANEPSTTPDLVIGLEGAFSINRLHQTWKDDNSKVANSTLGFKDFRNVKAQFAYVGSFYDTALTISKWAPFVGEPKVYDNYERNYGDHIARAYITCEGQWSTVKLPQVKDPKTVCPDTKASEQPAPPSTALPALDPSKILLVDASRVIRHNQPCTGGGAHSDVYSPEVANLVWDFIRVLEKR